MRAFVDVMWKEEVKVRAGEACGGDGGQFGTTSRTVSGSCNQKLNRVSFGLWMLIIITIVSSIMKSITIVWYLMIIIAHFCDLPFVSFSDGLREQTAFLAKKCHEVITYKTTINHH